jgi:hypothetical protein
VTDDGINSQLKRSKRLRNIKKQVLATCFYILQVVEKLHVLQIKKLYKLLRGKIRGI